MKLDMQPELKVQLELDAHEKECASPLSKQSMIN